jgi:hypothetical protein
MDVTYGAVDRRNLAERVQFVIFVGSGGNNGEHCESSRQGANLS